MPEAEGLKGIDIIVVISAQPGDQDWTRGWVVNAPQEFWDAEDLHHVEDMVWSDQNRPLPTGPGIYRLTVTALYSEDWETGHLDEWEYRIDRVHKVRDLPPVRPRSNAQQWAVAPWSECPCGAKAQVYAEVHGDNVCVYGDEPARCTECTRVGRIRYEKGGVGGRAAEIQWAPKGALYAL